MKGIWIIILLFLSIVGEGLGKKAKAPKPILDFEPSATSIRIQWKKPSSSHTITQWRIQHMELGGRKKQIRVDGDLSEYILEGLAPETTYRIRMLAQTASAGTGLPSRWTEITTLADTPEVAQPEPTPKPKPTIPNPPQRLTADATATTARITWSQPIDNGIEALGYIISYGPRDNPRENIVSVDINPMVKELDGLSSNVQYRLTMTAFNTVGQSDPATVDFFTLAEEIVKGPPPPIEAIEFQSISPTSIQVTWTLPDTTVLNEIENILFGFGDEGTPFKKLSTTNLERRTSRYTMDGLQPETRYIVMIVTENRYGESKRAEITVETIPIPVTTPAPSRARGPPPQPENVEYDIRPDGSLEISWTLPQTTTPGEIEHVGVGFGSYGIPPQFLTITELDRTTVRYDVTDEVTPGSRYTAIVVTRNGFGQSDPAVLTLEIPNDGDESSESSIQTAEVEEVIYLEVPSDVHAQVLTPRSVRLSFVDPTLEDPAPETVDDRYYTVRYKTDDQISFQYMHFVRTNDVISDLLPEANYQFEVKVVRGVNGHSLYSIPVNVFTRDPDHASKVSDVTVIQMRVINADHVFVIINWLPPQNVPIGDITGYVLEYTEGWPTQNSTWERLNITSAVPNAKIHRLRTSTSYYLRVAHLVGEIMGEFSDPPDVATTPSFQLGQPFDHCGDPTPEQIIARVNWMRSGGPQTRTALLGVPLPYCDDYYARHECHGLVCFCVPGKRPSCGSPPGVQGDQPPAAPCYNEYEAALKEIKDARKSGKPVNDAHLPYCTEDGYYQPKQCLGSLCYCSTRAGMHTGKEVPIWEANTLHC
ncbi:neogenin-like [Amphiura filiformis]|uniref:neogenin-like n=1 Tax=Amphiura filiformis TaxID=82378 RepID=UPI003B2125A2